MMDELGREGIVGKKAEGGNGHGKESASRHVNVNVEYLL